MLKDKKTIDAFRKIIMTKEEFMKGAKPSDLFKKVNEEIATEVLLIDESLHRIKLDFSILANQSVTNPKY